eukprot:CAMPEP_0197258346 /NCGR_PEP_ID=MMETSP1429-20130617/81791_1 /TAXON_ID=49237 /ORGANISM="Chaetoceros  sp., Strain UNC1202" /LENGTH=198 /DNA_ID=CAMNT_0042722427 /DNA_START=168 /DNA_END=764 /DNA_ORIENTATION=+
MSGVYGMGISAVTPRPVAVITSQSEDGVVNCAPFSYSGLLSHDPPMVCHGLCLSGSRKKDTLINIESTKQWVFNVLSESWLAQANACSEAVDPSVSEVDMVGLHVLPCINVQVPRLAEAMVSLECELDSTKEIFNDQGVHTTTVVFGKVVRYHVHSSVLGGTEARPVIDLHKMKFVGRAGGVTYWPCGEAAALDMKRP